MYATTNRLIAKLMSQEFRSSALDYRNSDYPTEWESRVPKRVRMLMTVSPAYPFLFDIDLIAFKGEIYETYVNSFGSLAVIVRNRKLLGLVTDEYEIVEWHTLDV